MNETEKWAINSAGVILLMAFNQETYGVDPQLQQILLSMCEDIPEPVLDQATRSIGVARQIGIESATLIKEVEQMLKETNDDTD